MLSTPHYNIKERDMKLRRFIRDQKGLAKTIKGIEELQEAVSSMIDDMDDKPTIKDIEELQEAVSSMIDDIDWD
jgi:division protein CdvB (Snf7/Vps24/ESCRT-III family)